MKLTEIISTGGTIDSYFDQKHDKIVPLKESVIPHYFSDIVRVNSPCKFHELVMKDSRDFNLERDAEDLVAHIRSSVASSFIVTIGTFAMPDVALQLAAAFPWKTLKKQIIFTGAMSPMYGFLRSDGGFNLGYAFAHRAPHPDKSPVTLAMNAEISPIGTVVKDLRTGNFRPLNLKGILERNLKNPVHLISTGGTIDGKYDALDGIVLTEKSYVPQYLKLLEIHKKISFTKIKKLKHSFNLDSKDFLEIFESIKESPHKNIIITVGIYSLQRLAAYLQENFNQIKEKQIVLTGSRYTLFNDDLTDGSFNLGYALGIINSIEPGVHVALSGSLVAPEKVMETLYSKEELEKIKKEFNDAT
jgi:L-asparaginase